MRKRSLWFFSDFERDALPPRERPSLPERVHDEVKRVADALDPGVERIRGRKVGGLRELFFQTDLRREQGLSDRRRRPRWRWGRRGRWQRRARAPITLPWRKGSGHHHRNARTHLRIPSPRTINSETANPRRIHSAYPLR